jgi:hypothetical protein
MAARSDGDARDMTKRATQGSPDPGANPARASLSQPTPAAFPHVSPAGPSVSLDLEDLEDRAWRAQ